LRGNYAGICGGAQPALQFLSHTHTPKERELAAALLNLHFKQPPAGAKVTHLKMVLIQSVPNYV
jgi:hypothetical protein